MRTVRERVGYLLRRAGFGEPPALVDAWTGRGLAETVEALLTPPTEPEAIAPPDLGEKQPYTADRLVDGQTYWLHRMAVTRHPLVEKMTLFWHGHFATGIHKVKAVSLMQRQNELLRRHALGSFPALLREMAADPAMLLWLDGTGSTKQSPNENYAREVMELFTCGPGPYTEQDVQEAARAFTGWRVNRLTLEARFFPRAYDHGAKTFLGRTGQFGADEIGEILSALPETARFLSTKLWRSFASPVVDQPTVERMAQAYLSSGGQIAPMLRELFHSDAFYSDSAAGSLVKAPADLVAGTYRVLGLPVGREATALTMRMGQTLYDPPNVAGWPGGGAWLGSSVLLARLNLGEVVRYMLKRHPAALGRVEAATPAGLVDGWLSALGVENPSPTTRSALLELVGTIPKAEKLRLEVTVNLIRTVLAAPEYQTV